MRSVQLSAVKKQLKGEQLTRGLMTNELRKALAHSKKSGRHLDQRNKEIAALKEEVKALKSQADTVRTSLAEKDSVVRVRSCAVVVVQVSFLWPRTPVSEHCQPCRLPWKASG